VENKNTIEIPGRPPLTREERWRQSRIWFGIAIVPVLVLVNMFVNYASVDWAGETHNRWLLHVIPLPFIALAVLGVVFGFRESRRTSENVVSNRVESSTPEETLSIAERTLFMARMAIVLSGISVLLMLSQWIATFIIDPMKP
jgi:hypothetical protein